jgi:hypothetical protein
MANLRPRSEKLEAALEDSDLYPGTPVQGKIYQELMP